jgi:ADP-ribosylglycohydrolase
MIAPPLLESQESKETIAMHVPEPDDEREARLRRMRLSLDGLSVGDAFGQQFFYFPEFIAPRRLPADPWTFTDDTVMALSVGEVLAKHGRIEQDELALAFARRYCEEPHRGYGGTAHGILREMSQGKSWRAVAPAVFGGQGSMGNGGAMRVAPLGAWFADDLERAARDAADSAAVTHSHPEGQAGAIAIAVAAATAWSLRGQPAAAAGPQLLRGAYEWTPDGATREGIARAIELSRTASVDLAATALGNGAELTAPDTVPFTLWCAARHCDDFAEAMWTTVSGLGDRDTTCAIVGGIVALSADRGIPGEWLAAREPLPPLTFGTA